ncbi:MAG: PAS domain-containing protein [Pseudomonadota bacterium]
MSTNKKSKPRTDQVKLTAIDLAILQSHAKVLDGLAEYLGGGYEFVLHSLENLDSSVVKIINGHHTGRSAGAPITDLALGMLAKINNEEGAEGISYFGKTRKGEPLKSTTIIIRGQHNLPIGVLCINFHLNTPLQDVLGSFIQMGTSLGNGVSENFAVDVQDTILTALEAAKKKIAEMTLASPSVYNKTLIAILYEQGVFKLKGAVLAVAEVLGVSKNTVYLHLRTLQESDELVSED